MSTRTRRFGILVTFIFAMAGTQGCSGKGSSSNNGTFDQLVTSLQVRAFNVDNVEDVYLNDQLVLEVPLLGDSGFVDLTPFLASGTNDLELTDTNVSGPWTYGFQVVANGATILDDECGTADSLGRFGCDDGDATLGAVYDQALTFQAP